MQLGKTSKSASNNNHRCISNDNSPSSTNNIMKQELSTTFHQKTRRRRRRTCLFSYPYSTTFIIYSQMIITIISLLNYRFLSPASSFVLPTATTKTSINNMHHPFVTSNNNIKDASFLTIGEGRQKSCVVMEAIKKDKGLVVYKNKKKNRSSTTAATTNAAVKVSASKSKNVKIDSKKKRYMDEKSMDRILNGDDDDDDDDSIAPTSSIPNSSPKTSTTTTKKKKKSTSPFTNTMKHFSTLTSSSNTDRVLHANVKETGKDTMSQYFKSIGNHELLRHEDEIVLGKQIQKLVKWEATRNELEGELLREPTVEEWANALNQTTTSLKKQIQRSQRAKTALVEANLRLVITIARQNLKGTPHTTKTINFEEACQDGIIGLIKACEKFDPTQGFRFSTYAHWWIKRQIKENYMQQTSNNKRAYNLPYHVLRKINHMKIIEVTLREENRGKKPSDQLLAKKLEITVDKLNYYRKLSQDAISLDKQLSIKQGKGSRASGPSATSSTIYDVTPDKENMTPIEDTDKQMLQHDVRRLINTLSPREQAVIRLRFGLMTDDSTPQTLENIAKRFRVSTDKIRMIETSALKKLKQPYRSSSLKCYVSEYL